MIGKYNVNSQKQIIRSNVQYFLFFDFIYIKAVLLKPIRSILCILLLLSSIKALGQELSNYRERNIEVRADTIHFDTLSIIPGTMIIEDSLGNIIDQKDYELNEGKAYMVWKKAEQPIKISYRVFPYNFTKSYYHKDYGKLQQEDGQGEITPYIFFYGKRSDKLINFGTMNYSGSISRGISFGNNQDMVVNSSLNLQLSGMVTEDVEVIAAITDENIPIQPEGNTQQIQDFDKVYIQINKGISSLIVGDIEVKRPKGYFMNFYKKAKGIQLKARSIFEDKSKLSFNPTLSVAKGKFAKNTFDGEEGNQGPYRLIGNNGETFIIILAGTERIYIDGKLLTRGAHNDYTIDYNLGEITFTPNVLITKDVRIVIEFEYSDQNYFRSLLHFNAEYESKKIDARLNIYTEQDHKNQPIQQDLTPEDKTLIGGVGDSTHLAFIPGISKEPYSVNRIMYRITDTTVGVTLYDTVFVYSTDPDSGYILSFSNVGMGNGNYVIVQSLANGRVYKWIAPVGGILQGDYEPKLLLVTPKQQQLYTIGIDYKFKKKSKISTEIAVSNNDINTFSSIHKKNDFGYAAKVGYKNDIQLNDDKKNKLVLKTNFDYEYANRLFEPLERYRPVEFGRDWNIKNIASNEDDHLGRVGIGLSKGKIYDIDYHFSTLIKGADYNGYKHTVTSSYTKMGFTTVLKGSILTTNGKLTKTRFYRPNLNISKSLSIFKGIIVGARGDMERNEIYDINSDTLTNKSFQYIAWSGYIRSNDSLKNKYSIDFTQRRDMAVDSNEFKESAVANTINIKNELLKNKKNRLVLSFTYRDLQVDTTLTNQKKDNTLLGRLEYNLIGIKGVIRANTLYELGRGLEQKRQFTYLPVFTGEGNYIWNDYNDNKIKELNEFELKPSFHTGDTTYLRTLNPTNEYQKTFKVQFNQSLSISPKAIWFTKQGVRKLLSKFSTLSTLQIQRKTLEDKSIPVFNPFIFDIADTSLVTLSSIIRNTLFFNRTGSKFGADISMQNNKTKQVLVSGFESRTFTEGSVKPRWNISKSFALRFAYNYSEKENQSEISPDNKYYIVGNKYAPSLTYQLKNIFKVGITYNLSETKNLIDSSNYNDFSLGRESSINHDISLDIRFNVVSRSILRMKVSYVFIDFIGNKNSPMGYAMLGGLQPGSNALWTFSWNRQFENNMQISLIYDGRTSESAGAVHTGRAEVRYLF